MKKKYRIKKSSEIQQLMKKKNTVGNSYFVLYYQKNHEIGNFRYAISVPKKFGMAHERNFMKRHLREVVKINDFFDDVDFFIIAKLKSKILNFFEIKSNVEDLLKKANLLKRGSNENEK